MVAATHKELREEVADHMYKQFTETKKKPEIMKIEWDPESEAATDSYVVKKLADVEDTWEGYEYLYYVRRDDKSWFDESFNADEIRDMMSTSGY